MISSICDALSACEQLAIVHNDLKPGNILVNFDTDRSGNILYNCYLNDYGCAELFVDRKLLSKQLTKAIQGLTPHYAAPEMLLAKLFMTKDQTLETTITADSTISSVSTTIFKYGNKPDVYSYGIIMFETIFQRHAFDPKIHLKEVIEFVLREERPQLPINLDKAYKKEDANLYFVLTADIMQKAWAHDPIDRPTFAMIFELLESISCK
jgi:serine/threonine protein kinase